MNRKQTTVKDLLNRKMFSNMHYEKEEGGTEGADAGVSTEKEFDGASFRGETKTEPKETPERTPEEIAAEQAAAEQEKKPPEGGEGKTPEQIAAEKEAQAKEAAGTKDGIDDYWDALSSVI